MSTENIKNEEKEIQSNETAEQEVEEKKPDEKTEAATDKKSKKKSKDKEKIDELENKLTESEEKYVRLSAEFDNYRKRTLKEKMDLTKSAGEGVLMNILPIIDDFGRAMQSMQDEHEEGAIKDGIELIYNKFNDFLKQNGVKAIGEKGSEFDTDIHEAVTKIPAPEENLKGKVVDVIQKGYSLNDKVIRFAKVVIGE